MLHYAAIRRVEREYYRQMELEGGIVPRPRPEVYLQRAEMWLELVMWPLLDM